MFTSILKQFLKSKLVPQDTNDEPVECLNSEVNFENLPVVRIRINLEKCVAILDGRRISINSNERSKRSGSIPYYGSTRQVGWIDDYLFI